MSTVAVSAQQEMVQNKMQAIILCAGMGTRISESIDYKPKCMLYIGESTIIEHQIRILKSYLIRPPSIVVGYKQDMIIESLKGEDVEFIENPEYASTNILTSLWYAFREKEIQDTVMCLPGDLIFDDKIIMDLLGTEGEITIAVQERQCDNEAVKVLVEDNTVVAIGKELKAENVLFEFLGLFKIDKEFVPVFRNEIDGIIESGNNNAYMFTAIQHLIDKGVKVGYVDIGEMPWEEVDYPEDYASAKEKFKRFKWQS